MTSNANPGWSPALRKAGSILLFFGLFRPRPADGLTLLRTVFLAFIAALLLYLYVLSFIVAEATKPASAPGWVFAVIAIEGMLSLAVGDRLRRRALRTTSLTRLASSYATRMYIGLASAETPALLGFAFSFITRSIWTYAVGMAIGLVGLGLAAPTSVDIGRQQQKIAAEGSPLSLLEALLAPPSGRRWRR